MLIVLSVLGIKVGTGETEGTVTWLLPLRRQTVSEIWALRTDFTWIPPACLTMCEFLAGQPICTTPSQPSTAHPTMITYAQLPEGRSHSYGWCQSCPSLPALAPITSHLDYYKVS